MIKNLKYISLAGILLFAGISCSDNDPKPTPNPEPKPTTYEMTTGFYNILENNTEDGFQTVNLTMSNEDGAAVSAILLTRATEDGSLRLPTFVFTAVDDKEIETLNKGPLSYFTMPNDDTKYLINTGVIDVVFLSDNVYEISGSLASEDNKSFKFSFEDALNATKSTSNYDVDIKYDNKWARYKFFNYTMKFTEKETGAEVQFEFNATFTDYYLNFAEATYSLTNNMNELGISPSDDNYFITETGGAKKSISEASLTITPQFGIYLLKGTFKSSDGTEMPFEYTGGLPVNSANLLFKEGLMLVRGQYWDFASYDYYLGAKTGYTGNIREEFWTMLNGPLNKYYEYMPIATGKYVCDDEKKDAFYICTDGYYGATDIAFLNESGNYTPHLIQDGYLTIVSMDEGSGNYEYKTVAEGVFETEVIYDRSSKGEIKEKYFLEEEGKKMTITVKIEADIVSDPRENYENSCHPYTQGLPGNVNRTDLTQGIIWYDEPDAWGGLGIPSGAAYVDIWLATENGVWFEWWDSDIQRDDNFFFLLGLYVDADHEYDVVPEGTWTADWKWEGEPGTYQPGNKIQGFSNVFTGGNYINGDYSIQAPFGHGPSVPGTVTVTNNNNGTYTVTGDVYDDRGLTSKNIKFTYTGELVNSDDIEFEGFSSQQLLNSNINGKFRSLDRNVDNRIAPYRMR